MEYIALYRRYRPKSFLEITGQENIVKILKNQIATDKISHAYLFSGTRGTGKTSAAKIFAKAVNCENNSSGEPCHNCKTCTSIEKNNVMDIIEIDAASNRGVDEIRELRENVKYLPTVGKYKVYIIDEVHMLTSEAFNALLKTLEEPPKHIIFILATTEPNKLPTTILSRCQRFNFRRIEVKDIVNRMKYICQQVQVDIEDRTLELIAKNADGAMRDALSILEQCLSISEGNKVEYNSVKELLGLSDNRFIYGLIETIVYKDVASALSLLDEAYENGKEISQLVNQLVFCFRDMLIYKMTESTYNLLETSEENIDKLKNLSLEVSHKLLTYYIDTLTEMETKVKYSTVPKVLMEVILIKLCTAEIAPITANREDISFQSVKASPIKERQVKKEVKQEIKEENEPIGETDSDSTFNFNRLVAIVQRDQKFLASSLSLGKCKVVDENKIEIYYKKDDTFHMHNVQKNIRYIEEIINKAFKKTYKVNCIVKEEGDELVKVTKELFGEDKVVVIDE